MLKRFLRVFIGTTIASFGIAAVMNSGYGAFAVSGMNKAVANWFGIPFVVANILTELLMIAYATYKGEGLGWAAIINGTYGAVMISLFHEILPHVGWIFWFGLLIPIGWSIMEKGRLGATGSNVLMIAIMKQTGLKITTVRVFEEGAQLLIALLGAREYVTWVTVVLVFAVPVLLRLIYKITNHKPTQVEHDYIHLLRRENC